MIFQQQNLRERQPAFLFRQFRALIDDYPAFPVITRWIFEPGCTIA